MSRNIFFAAAGLVLFCTMPLAAQDAVLGQLYGNGVHAYFGQDYIRAHELFTQAIDGHTQDPRAYYFRGLTMLKLGRPQEADNDFKAGAKLESRDRSHPRLQRRTGLGAHPGQRSSQAGIVPP